MRWCRLLMILSILLLVPPLRLLLVLLRIALRMVLWCLVRLNLMYVMLLWRQLVVALNR